MLIPACASAPPPAPPAEPALLKAGATVELELAPGATHEHRIAMSAGEYARVSVDQSGADVELRLLDPDGRLVAAVDGPGARKVPETLSWIAASAGAHRLSITSLEGEPGRCAVTLEELRPGQAGDAARVGAEAAYAEAEHWVAREDEPSRRKALVRLADARALWRLAGDRPGEVEALSYLGAIHRTLGDTATAVRLYRQALSLALEAGDLAGEGRVRNNLGVAHHQLGEIPRAEEQLRQALRIWERLSHPEELANTLYGLGVVQFSAGDMDAALAALSRALEIRRAAGNRSDQALTLTAIASIHRDRGDGDLALDLYRQALEISRSTGDRHDEANVLQNMASIYLRRGELQRALELYTAALDLHRLLGNRAQEGWVLSYLGAAALHLGDPQQALRRYTEALDIHRALGSTVWQAYTLRDIGWIYALQGNPELALEQYTRAYELSQDDRRSQALALHGIGHARLALGDSSEAVRTLEQSIELYRETGSALGEINALVELGRAFQALGDIEGASARFQRALALSRERKTLVAEALALSAVARLEGDRGNLAAAVAAMEESLAIVESIRPKVASQRQRISFFASRREQYDFYIDLRMRLHEQDPEGPHLAAALAASERARARGLLDLFAEGRIDLQRGISPELKKREEENANRISLRQSQLLDDLARGGLNARRIEADLDQAEEERERIQWQIRREHPRYAAVRNPSPLPPDRLRELLDERTAFLELSVGKEASFLFVVTREGLEGHRLPGAEVLAEDVDSVREALQSPGRRQRRRYVDAAQRLYQTLLAPAEAALRNKPHLIISPDGPLLLLSFEALLTSPAGSVGKLYAGLPYLLREKSVTYVPSASILAELALSKGSAAADAGSIPFVAFADPDYGAAAATGEIQAGESGRPAEPAPLTHTFRDAGLPSPRPLPESRTEVERISDLYPPGEARVYLDREATEENVKDNALLRKARRIHFAVHGFVDETRPELSGLVLSLDDDPRENGLLQVYEIFNLDLSADLVVLSACESALGRNVGGEGILGLSRALLYAGAASVVVSLWQVLDTSTADLMIRFYRHLGRTGDKAEALRLAKLEILREGRYDHPYHWAPFILVGRPEADVTPGRAARQ